MAASNSIDTVRVLVVDDNRVMREGVEAVLRGEEGVTLAGSASDGEEALAVIEDARPDVVLMDINMPRVDGIQATRAIKRQRPEAIVFGISVHSPEDEAAEAMRQAGATAVYNKSDDPANLIAAILETSTLMSRLE